MEENERDFVTFTDEEGNEFELDVIDYFDYQDEEYALLIDLSENADCGDGCEQEVYIMKVVVNGDTEEFVPADDDKMDALVEIAEARFAAGCDCDDSVREEALSALGLTRSQLLAYRDHPLDNLGRLVAAHIPALLVCGDADMSVPPEENGLLLKAAYEQAGVPLLFMLKPGCGHHPHGPSDMAKALEFLRAW